MDITFDPDKDLINRTKHGVSLAEAANLDWANALVWLDQRKDYGENREIALGAIGNVLYYVAFVERSDVFRIISMRRATNKEIQKYVDET